MKQLLAPPSLAKLTTFLLLAVLVAPLQAQLVIPATTGTEACTQGGASETGTEFGNLIGTPTNDSLAFNIEQISFGDSFTVYAGVQEGGRGTHSRFKILVHPNHWRHSPATSPA